MPVSKSCVSVQTWGGQVSPSGKILQDEGVTPETLVASAVVNGALQTKTLNGGESWIVGGDVVPVQIQLLQWQLDQINLMITDIANGVTPAVSPIGQVIIQPFNGGPEPGQAPASGAVPPTPTPNPYTPPDSKKG